VIDPTSVQVYFDDMNGSNDLAGTITDRRAYLYKADGIKDTTYFEGNFDVKSPNTDFYFVYFYGPYYPILVIQGGLPANYVLGVTYKEVAAGQERWVGNPDPGNLELKIIAAPVDELAIDVTTGKWGPLSRYELKNVYFLGSEAIIKDSFRLAIKKRSGGAGVDQEALNGVPYIQILGLDTRGPTSGSPPDGLIDEGQLLDFTNGLLVFPDLHPFAPDSFDITSWVLSVRPDTLTGDETNPNVYTKKFPNFYLDTRYYMDVEYKSPQTTFFLGFNVLENSEVVTLNGTTLQRGTGYTIDYETGELVLLTPDALQPTADVSVDFSRASMFGLSKTLLGFATQYKPTEEVSFGTTWLYESKGTPEERPRLEQEPSRTVVGGLSTAMKFSPAFMTNLVDALPLVRTRERSSLAISGEMGLSVPNPNTRNEVYIDDMEGNKETRPLGLIRTLWKPSSIPDDPLLAIVPTGKRALWWYNLHPQFNEANVVHEGDLYPERTQEERERAITALELYFNQTQGAHGLTQVFSFLGEDFTEMQYVEIWVNDFGGGRDASKKIRFDLGLVSEDGTWDPDSVPNGRLDTEDTSPPNGQLDISPIDEDTGLDGKRDGEETCIPGVTGDPPDCSEDDYKYDPQTAPTDFSHINGTEGNRLALAHPIPDTEDLDGDGRLDQEQNYIEYVVTLEQGSRFQVRDNGNGWRLFRIPLSDTLATKVGLPRWDNVKHARLWFDGFSEGEKLQIADIEVVGNRWVITPVSSDSSFAQGERLFVGVINNKDNGDIYQPPPIQIGEENKIPKREQSLVLNAKNLFPSDTLAAYKSFAGGNDYTQYKSMKFWLRGDGDSLIYFMRFGTDSLNFYEFATPVPRIWENKELNLEDLSILKVGLPTSVVDTTIQRGDGGWTRLKGRPSFTRIQRITMGLVNVASRTGSTMVASDSVWVDELVLTSVKREKGMARRLFVETKFADLLSLTTQMEYRDQDFLSIGSTRGSGRRTGTYSVSGAMALHKFIPKGEFNIPVTFAVSSRKEIPKFRTGDDIVLTKQYEEAQTSQNGSRTLGVSFRKSASPSKWLRYTVEAIGLGFSMNETHSASVTSVDSSRTLSGSLSYSFTPPAKSGLKIPFGRGRKLSVYLWPNSLSFTARGLSSRFKSYQRDVNDPSNLIQRSDVRRRTGDFGLQTSYVPISILKCNYSINSSRDWMLYNPSKTFGNIGVEVSRSQNFRAELTPKLGNWLTPNASFSSTYSEDHRPEITRADDESDVRNVSNSGGLSFGLSVPISRLAQVLRGETQRTTSKDSVVAKSNEGLSAVALVLGKIGDVRANHSISYGSSYSRMYGRPNVSYMFGVRRATGGSARLAGDGIMNSSIGNATSLAASGRPARGVSLDGKFETSNREAAGLTGLRVEKKTTWPELRLGWSGIETQLKVSKTVTSLRLDSNFRRTVEESGAKGRPSEKVVTRSDWQPLVNLTASWKSGMRTSYTSNISTVQTESRLGSGYTSKTTTSTHSFSIQQTIDATKGIALPFMSSRKFKLKSSVNLGLVVQYSSVSSTIPPQLSEKKDDLSVTSTATYSFSSNLTGSFNFGFTQNRDLQIGVTRRGIRTGLTASFRF
jgi:hypothetical protein